MTSDDLKVMVRLTFRNPEQAAHVLMAQGYPMSVRWMALVLAVSVSGVLAWISMQLYAPPAEDGMPVAIGQQPVLLAGMQLGAITIGAWLMTGVGRMFGGHGRFEDALLLVVWIEAILLIVQAAQIVLGLILPGMGGILGILSIALFLWLTVQFVKALHGFSSGPRILLVIFATMLALGFVLSFFAASLGLLPEMPQ
ncbi:MAG: Yip1 family protein [Paracoccus sp. (in: a-proteobacteria)]|nr:Yip1 family protein [Paracoccus sp. (in: a-proteobacteria)]